MNKPLRVLLVEDSEDDTLLIIRALTKGGYDPAYQRVETAEAMRNALREKTWDVLLCDYRLPQFSGLAAIALLKEAGIDLPLIIVSSTIGEETAADCLRYGARDWVRKSNLSRLVPAIERELQEAESRSKRKQAEEAVKKLETKYRKLHESMMDGFIFVSMDGTIKEYNKSYLEMIGYTPEEVSNLTYRDITPEKWHSFEQNIVEQQILTSGYSEVYEKEYRKKDGTVFPVELRTFLIKDETGGNIGMWAIVRDITKRWRAQEKLRESEEALVEAQAIGKIGSWQYDVVKDNPAWSAEMFRIFGRDPALGEPSWMEHRQSIHPEDWERIDQALQDAVGKCVSYRNEFRIVHPDGSVIWAETIGNVQPDESCKVGRLSGTVQDITERKQAEEALRTSEWFLKSTLDGLSFHIAVLDDRGEIILTNKAYRDFAERNGIEPRAVSEGINYLKTCDTASGKHSQDAAPFAEGIREVLSGKSRCFELEYPCHSPDEKRWFVGRVTPINDERQRRVVVAHENVTERRQMEESLRKNEIRYRELFENMRSGVSVYETLNNGEDFIFKEYNAAAEKLDNTPREQAIGRSVFDVFPGVKAFGLFDVFQRVYRTGTPERHPATFYKDEKISGWRENYVYKLPSGEIVAVYEDITERKQAEEKIRRSEENFRKSFDELPLGVRIVSSEGETLYTNKALLDIYGYNSLDELKAIPPMKRYTPESYAEFLTRREKRQQGMDVPSEYAIDVIRKDGEVRHLQIWRKEIIWDGEKQFQVIYQDITDRKRAEEELKSSRLQLRALYKRLQKIREDERFMVAREIHDEMGGGLTGLKMDLSWMLRKLCDEDPSAARVALMDKIHTAKALIDQMIREVRRISSALRPSVLDDLGLIAALEWQLAEFTNRTEIPHEFVTTCEYINIEKDTAVAVFRIFQEALTNVLRHARATKVTVDLREGERSLFGDNSFVLEICDNGRGITQEEIMSTASLGLLGMKERVLAFGGEISLRGEPGGGTALVLQIPSRQGETS